MRFIKFVRQGKIAMPASFNDFGLIPSDLWLSQCQEIFKKIFFCVITIHKPQRKSSDSDALLSSTLTWDKNLSNSSALFLLSVICCLLTISWENAVSLPLPKSDFMVDLHFLVVINKLYSDDLYNISASYYSL